MSKFQISPNVQFGIGLTVVMLTVFSKGSVQMPMGIPPIVGQYINSWANFLLLLYAPAATFMAAFSSSQPGWLAPPDPPAVKATIAKEAAKSAAGVIGALLIGAVALVSLSIAVPTSAYAAPKKVAAPMALGGNPLNALGDWAVKDVATTIAASTQYANLSDDVGKVCLTEISTLATLFHDHPLPLTFHLATDIEYARLDQAELNRICRVPECAQVWQDMANAAKALEILPLPISFSSLCGKVPIVGLTMSTATPAATPTPAPTPKPTPTVSPTPTPTPTGG